MQKIKHIRSLSTILVPKILPIISQSMQSKSLMLMMKLMLSLSLTSKFIRVNLINITSNPHFLGKQKKDDNLKLLRQRIPHNLQFINTKQPNLENLLMQLMERLYQLIRFYPIKVILTMILMIMTIEKDQKEDLQVLVNIMKER
jgi:hypothetical protein